ncbi:MAG: DUF4180 domain-containing protein [Hamadaea sp.]|nr:DUF4180 domain-containing protein [Hamadaea sp.]
MTTPENPVHSDPDHVVELSGTRALVLSADGPRLAAEVDVTDLIGQAFGDQADLVVIPAERLADEFFTLRTGFAGTVVQKFVNYRIRLVVLGDIDGHVERSTALRDFVTESNRGRQLWFLPSLAELEARLAG